MAYTPPSLQIYQEFIPSLPSNTLPLYACILAPQYALHRFTETDEQALLGAYDYVSGNIYSAWPDKHVGSTVDLSSAKIWIKDATIKYHTFTTVGGLNVNGGNKVRSSSLVFRTENGYTRSSVYGTRDVELADYVKVSWGGSSKETIVAGFEADIAVATRGSATAASTNAAAKTVGATVTQHIASSDFTVTASAAAYNGLADGYPEETYTATVISTDGTVEGTTVRIVSASGTDNVSSLALTASGVANLCGTRGATFTVTDAKALNSSSSSHSTDSGSDSHSSSMSTASSLSSQGLNSSSSSGDIRIQVGDYWTVDYKMTYVKPTPVAGGTYTGSTDTTYLVKITSGGTVGTDTITFSVSTADGSDGSYTDVPVTGAGTYSAGNYGVTFAVTAAAQYVTGDIWSILVTAEAEGPIRTLILADMLTGATTSDTLTVILGLTDTIELDKEEWTASATQIVVGAGAEYLGTYLGVTQTFDILAGDSYIDYRELLIDSTTEVGILSALSDVVDTLGPVHPDNPLALMVYAALNESDGTPVYYIGVASDDANGYSDACEKLTEVSEVYGLVPYNTSNTVGDVVHAHVTDMAAPDVAMFRKCWIGIDTARTAAYYTATGAGAILAAKVSGTTLTSTNATFITNNVRAGDSIHINYHPDGRGGITYDTYTVVTVDTEVQLTITPTVSSPIPVAVKMEVWRTATASEYAVNISAVAQHYSDRRVNAVWSDDITFNGMDVTKAILAAGLAGLRSGVAPHQPLTNVNVSGSWLITNTVNFGSSKLNVMAGNGVWLVVKDIAENVFTRHQLTTDMTELKTQEDTITSNLDHICRDYKTGVSDLYGRGNVSTQMIELIRSRVYSISDRIMARNYSDVIGPQLQDMTIISLAADPVAKDHVNLELEPTLPYPMNNLTVKFRII